MSTDAPDRIDVISRDAARRADGLSAIAPSPTAEPNVLSADALRQKADDIRSNVTAQRLADVEGMSDDQMRALVRFGGSLFGWAEYWRRSNG